MDLSDVRTFLPTERFQPTLALSPDGTAIAYVSNTSGQYNVWVRALDGSNPRQLTHYTEHTVRRIVWSPDGTLLAFTADRHGDEQHQIYLLDIEGGEPQPLTSATDRQYQLASSPFTPGGISLLYGGNDRDPAVHETIVHNLRSGQVRRIRSLPGTLLQPASVSPDGQWLLACGERSNTNSDCYLIDLTDPASLPVVVAEHGDDAIHRPGPWAADSTGFLLLTDRGREFQSLAFYSLRTKKIELVETPDWDVEEVTRSVDGSTMVWTVNEGGRSVLRGWRDDALLVLSPLPVGLISSLRVSRDGRTLAFFLNTAARPAELAVVDVLSGTLRLLSDSRPPAMQVCEPRVPDLVDYLTHDGRRIPAYLYRPEMVDRPCPMVLSIHGGPEAQERPAYSALYQCWLANGIGVLAPNIRGSSGYGISYQRLIHHDWGGDELADLEHAARFLRTLGWVNPDRIGVYGLSFGGFAVLSCLSRLPHLWAAGVSVVGPSNLVTLTRSVPKTWSPIVAKEIGDPDTETDFLLERSPVTYADQISAPLFVVQGANDPRVVKAESDQIVERALTRGADVRYDVYEDEGHGFTNRDNEIKALADIAGFLIDHLNRTPVH